MSGAKIRATFPGGKMAKRCAKATAASATPSVPLASRAAQMLALAHHVEHLIEAGELKGYAEAAQILGVTRARLTQVMNLLLLSPRVQESVLRGRLRSTERSLRHLGREANWQEQERKLDVPGIG